MLLLYCRLAIDSEVVPIAAIVTEPYKCPIMLAVGPSQLVGLSQSSGYIQIDISFLTMALGFNSCLSNVPFLGFYLLIFLQKGQIVLVVFDILVFRPGRYICDGNCILKSASTELVCHIEVYREPWRFDAFCSNMARVRKRVPPNPPSMNGLSDHARPV